LAGEVQSRTAAAGIKPFVPTARAKPSELAGGWSRCRQRLAEHVFASQTLFGLWVYARDDRPWSGADPPAAVFVYSPDRRAERPATHLANFKGVVQVDGYSGFERLSDGGAIKLAACWSHTRRKFYEVHQATSLPIARGPATGRSISPAGGIGCTSKPAAGEGEPADRLFSQEQKKNLPGWSGGLETFVGGMSAGPKHDSRKTAGVGSIRRLSCAGRSAPAPPGFRFLRALSI